MQRVKGRKGRKNAVICSWTCLYGPFGRLLAFASVMQPAALPRLHTRIRPEILHKKSWRKIPNTLLGGRGVGRLWMGLLSMESIYITFVRREICKYGEWFKSFLWFKAVVVRCKGPLNLWRDTLRGLSRHAQAGLRLAENQGSRVISTRKPSCALIKLIVSVT